jgi:D-alanyl-lipoteichoic acid acyltransferase DltB (MBOAT superfamily)
MNRLGEYRYLALLLALLVMLVAYPTIRGPLHSRLATNLLITAVFLAGGWVVFGDKRLRVLGAVLAIPALLGAWTGYALPDLPGPLGAVFLHLFAAIFQVFVVVVLLRVVFREKTVSTNAIAGALCGYVLVGVAFGHIYCLVDETVPGSFRGTDGNPETNHFALTYFSFITLTTVGYGDITPTSGPARSLCVVEAVTGQFYLAVLIAGLIGKRAGQSQTERDE